MDPVVTKKSRGSYCPPIARSCASRAANALSASSLACTAFVPCEEERRGDERLYERAVWSMFV